MHAVARSLMPLHRGDAVPVPIDDWQRWPDAFQTHAAGPLTVTGAGSGRDAITCGPGQYHPISIRAVHWAESKAHERITLIWF